MKRALAIFAIAGCNTATINTPTRVFDRPSDVALACRQVILDPATQSFVFDAHPMSDCTPQRVADLTPPIDPNTGLPTVTSNGFQEFPVLAALVTQSARGELSLVDVSLEHVVDLQTPVPGFGFLPVGKLPEHVRVSDDGCLAVTANVDSCDLAVVDMATAYNMPFLPYRSPAPAPGFADQVVRRLAPTVGGKALGAQPSWIEFSHYTQPALRGFETGGTPGQCRQRVDGTPTQYRAWVALPGCSLVVEVDISATKANPDGFTPAEVTRAIRFTPTGAEVVSDLSTLSCPAECDGQQLVDGGAPANSDGGAPDGGTIVPTTQAQPATLALDDESGLARLFVGDRTGERITIVPFDSTNGNLGTPHQLALETGALGVQVVRVSPRSESGKFLYAVARDATVRVVDLDREVECETNPDPREFQEIPPPNPSPDPLAGIRSLGCFPLGDPNTPRRSSLATSPGITLPGLALPKDVAFVHIDAPPPVASNIAPPAAGPATLVGDFAWIISSDGRASVVNIFDACPAPNQPQLLNDGTYTPACAPGNVVNSRGTAFFNNFGNPLPMQLDLVAHRLRGGSSRFIQPVNPSDNVGQPRLSDPTNPFTIAVAGVPKAANSSDLAELPALASDPFPSPAGLPELPAGANFRYINSFDPDKVRSETWGVEWEGVVPGTHRTLGAVAFTDGTGRQLPHPFFLDNGAAWCSHGVRAGDKVQFVGCDVDTDCPYLDYCVRDPAAPVDVNLGMCLRQDKASQLQTTCKNLLQALRRYRILSAKQQAPIDPSLDSSGNSDILELGEIYEPEHPVETRTCTPGDACLDIRVIDAKGTGTLATTCLQDADGEHRCLRACDPNGDDAAKACGLDYQCLPSQLGDGRCMRSPLDRQLFEACMPELQTYEVHAGEAFQVDGSATGVLVDMQANPLTRECEIPPESNEFVRLHQARIPIESPQCPDSIRAVSSRLSALPHDFIDPTSGVATNVCQISPTVAFQNHPVTRLIHYENPMFSFLLQVSAGPAAGATSAPPDGGVDADGGTPGSVSGTPTVPPDQLVLSFILVGSGFPLGVALAVDVQAQQPRYAVTAPDRSTVFIVDEGKQAVGVGLRGQLLKLLSDAVAIDRSFQVR